MIRFTVTLRTTDPMLGTASANPELYREFIESKRPESVEAPPTSEADDLPTVAEEMQRGTTVFLRGDDGKPYAPGYWVKGLFKEACSSLRRVKGTLSAGLKAHRKVIDGLIFVVERQLPLQLPEGGDLTICERPLRARTPQGERVSLARSEQAPAGTKITFTLVLLKPTLEDNVREWLDYGQWRGLGQWRNSSKGAFTYEMKLIVPAETVDAT